MKIKLREHTSLCMGGEVEVIRLSSFFDAEKIWGTIKTKDFFLLGKGNNLIASEYLENKKCLKIEIDGVDFSEENNFLYATVGAGEDFPTLVETISKVGLTGFEVLAGIPGSVGAAPVQNIGAYGAEVSEFIDSISVYDTHLGEYHVLHVNDCDFGYRTSIFNGKEKGRYWILQVKFKFSLLDSLEINHADIISEVVSTTISDSSPLFQAVMSIRAKKGMLRGDKYPKSAGSFFKNPIITNEQFDLIVRDWGEGIPCYPVDDVTVKLPAAWLIDKSGVSKGYIHKGVGVSPYHNLSLINLGNGNFDELMELAEIIIDKVYSEFGIRLKIEPEIVK